MNIDSYDKPGDEELLRFAVRRLRHASDRRALITQGAAAAAVLLAAGLLAGLSHGSRSLSLTALVATVVAYCVAARVHFPVAAGWTRPTQIAFVPMLFLLPLSLVPAVVVMCLLLDLLPPRAQGRLSLTRLLTLVADSAYALAPVVVLIASGDGRFSWRHWPLYALAFGAQFVFDLGTGLARMWFAERVRPTEQRQMLWAYATDACLTCCGLLIAAATVDRPGLLLLTLPLIALLGTFARERQQRMTNTLELSDAYRGTALLLGDVIEEDDQYTGVHSRAVVDLSIAVACRLGLDADSRRYVEFGALLHDVGKIRVPKEIIHKPGKLSEDEWAVMRLHTLWGEEMLGKVGGTLAGVGRVVRSSHEHWNGRGYPDGLIGEEIPIESRIVSACDAFNAMTTERSYKPAMSLHEALRELSRCSGTQFDPAVVEALAAEVATWESSESAEEPAALTVADERSLVAGQHPFVLTSSPAQP